MLRSVLYFLLILFFVVSASAVSSHLWAGKEEVPTEDIAVTVSEGMTVAEFGEKHNLNRNVLKKVFNLTSREDLKNQVTDFGMNDELLSKKVNQLLAIQSEHESKNWFKTLLKGFLWVIFLPAVFLLIRKGRITAGNRKWIYIAAVGVFGVVLGSDPSPMGTVKDAVVLLDSKGVIFPPRLVVFGVFLLMVILANKFICSWGTCIEMCPANAISFGRGKRQKPPAGKFDKEMVNE